MKFILVLDMDETILHSRTFPPDSPQFALFDHLPTFQHVLSDQHGVMMVFYRPFLLTFLSYLKQYFHYIVLFSLAGEEMVRVVVENLRQRLGDPTYFDLVLSWEDCRESQRRYGVLKSMDYVKARISRDYGEWVSDLSVPLFIDNSEEHTVFDPETHFFLCQDFHPSNGDRWVTEDQELPRILEFIQDTFPLRV